MGTFVVRFLETSTKLLTSFERNGGIHLVAGVSSLPLLSVGRGGEVGLGPGVDFGVEERELDSVPGGWSEGSHSHPKTFTFGRAR